MLNRSVLLARYALVAACCITVASAWTPASAATPAGATRIVRSAPTPPRTNLIARSIEPSRQPKARPAAPMPAQSPPAPKPAAVPLYVPATAAPTAAPRPAVSAGTDSSGHPVLRALSGHLEVGTRSTWFRLLSRHQNGSTFYGSIDELDAVQNHWPLKVFASYAFCPYGGIDLTWDQVEFDTITRTDGHNDGTVDLHGPILSAFGRYPNETRFVPYGGIGVGYLFSDFHPTADWRYALRGEHTDYYGFEQEFDLKDTTAWVAYVGVSMALSAHWHADFYLRRMWAEVEGTHNRWQFDELKLSNDFSLPADNDAVGVGVRYVF